MSHVLNGMNKALRELDEAKSWHDLPNGNKYQNDTFHISPQHSELKLTRHGQQCCGGNNYWETSKAFGSAILQAIVENPAIIDKAIAIMERRADAAIVDCKDFHKKLGDKIAEAEGDNG